MLLKGFITILISVALAVGASLTLNFFKPLQTNDWIWSLAAYTAIFITLTFVYNYKTDGKTYSQVLLGTISGKLFILLIVILLYFVLGPQDKFAFFMHFLTHYILFTVFEIRYLLQIIKNKSFKNQ